MVPSCRSHVRAALSSGLQRVTQRAETGLNWPTSQLYATVEAGFMAVPHQFTRLLLLTVLAGCASTLPSWSGASTTPKHRVDLATGAAVRVPFGDLRQVRETPDESAYGRDTQSGGVVPVAQARYGLANGQDLGLLVAGATVRLDYRREFNSREGSTRPTWMFGASPFAGALTGDASGARFGLELPLLYGIDFGGLYDFWAGPRLRVEHVRGTFVLRGDSIAGHGTILSGGLVLGLAAGFRRVHAFLEGSFEYEHAFVRHGELDRSRGGFVITPSFGLRVRL